MRLLTSFALLVAIPHFLRLSWASPYREDLIDYNLNVNQDTLSPTEYDSSRPNISYTPSPVNWRALPVYTILLDKFADGDPMTFLQLHLRATTVKPNFVTEVISKAWSPASTTYMAWASESSLSLGHHF